MIALMLVGVFALARETWNRYEYWQIDVSGVSTQATIVDIVRCGGGDKIGVRYNDRQGAVVHTRPDLCFHEPYSVGQRITIWYRPADPARVVPAAEYRGSSFGDFVVALLLTVGISIFTLGGARDWWRGRGSRRQLSV